MDMLAVDLTPIPAADVGSAVELWGDCVPVDEVAACAGTIGYELLCAVSARGRRVVADSPRRRPAPPAAHAPLPASGGGGGPSI